MEVLEAVFNRGLRSLLWEAEVLCSDPSWTDSSKIPLPTSGIPAAFSLL